MAEYNVYTHYFNGVAGRIFLNVRVFSGHRYTDVRAFWDTGATSSCISNKVVSDLALSSEGVAQSFGGSGAFVASKYTVDIKLLDLDVTFSPVNVRDVTLDPFDADVLIGMDIICCLDSALTTDENGNSVFTVRAPSKRKPIDFKNE